MIRTPRRPVGLAVTAVALAATAALTLGGCAAGLGASTAQPYAASNGSVTSVGGMDIQDVVLVDDGSVAELSAGLINTGPTTDVLTAVAVSGANKPALPAEGLTVLPGQAVTIGPTSTNRVLLDGLTATLGQVVSVTFSFRDAGAATVSALILSPSDLTAGG